MKLDSFLSLFNFLMADLFYDKTEWKVVEKGTVRFMHVYEQPGHV